MTIHCLINPGWLGSNTRYKQLLDELINTILSLKHQPLQPMVEGVLISMHFRNILNV